MRVEQTNYSTVVVCDCGARFVHATRQAALLEASYHEQHAHAGVRAIRDTAARDARRAR